MQIKNTTKKQLQNYRFLMEDSNLPIEFMFENFPSAYRIMVIPKVFRLETMSFGGNSNEAVLSVWGYGSYPMAKDAHPSYISEKIRIPLPDAEVIAKMWSDFWEE